MGNEIESEWDMSISIIYYALHSKMCQVCNEYLTPMPCKILTVGGFVLIKVLVGNVLF